MSFENRTSTQDPGSETFSNQQEPVSQPLHRDIQKLAVRWITPIYNQEAVEKEEEPE